MLDTDRRLVVRIRRSPLGGKQVDVTLVEADGTTLAEEHKTFAATTECHQVLWVAARDTARLLGAFVKPPPPEPCPTCPAPPTPEPCPTCPSCMTCPLPRLPPRILHPAPVARWGFFGAGVFFGTGITPIGAMGPHFAFGFVPLAGLPRIQFEINAMWAPQMLPTSTLPDALRVSVVPLMGSLCYARYVFRACGGLATTFFSAEHARSIQGNDELTLTLAATGRVGTEFDIAGPLSIRVDGIAFLRFWERTSDDELARLVDVNPFAMGASAMAVWSIE